MLACAVLNFMARHGFDFHRTPEQRIGAQLPRGRIFSQAHPIWPAFTEMFLPATLCLAPCTDWHAEAGFPETRDRMPGWDSISLSGGRALR